MKIEAPKPHPIVGGACAKIGAGLRKHSSAVAAAARQLATVTGGPRHRPELVGASRIGASEHCERPHSPQAMTTQLVVGATTRSASQTRVLALSLLENPLPSLTKKCLERRWRVGPDSVRKILCVWGVGPRLENSLGIPLTDALLCEGFSHPFAVWISASPEFRKILSADLLTLEAWLAQTPEKAQRDKTKYYRELAEGRLVSVRIGKQHRFRPTLETALHWHAARQEARS